MPKPFAVVTGASSEMGRELAKQFAQNGYDLLIVSESEKILEARSEIEKFGARVNYLQLNIASFDGVERLLAAIQSDGRPVDAIAINTGEGVYGEFGQTKLKEEINLINNNVVSVVHLTKGVLKKMYPNKFGKILYISSPPPPNSPSDAVFKASRAFLKSFARSIRAEAKAYRIKVTVLMPSEVQDPAPWAEAGFHALLAGREFVFVASLKMKLQNWALKIQESVGGSRSSSI